MIDQAALKRVLDYDPDTGVFRWRVRGFRIAPGRVAGNLNRGYRRICIHGESYWAHRLAWLYMTGGWPEPGLDHINRHPDDNRWSNLRLATHAQNCKNRGKRSDSTSGVTGVSWYARDRKWRAYIFVDGKLINLGYYRDFDDARLARERRTKELFGAFAP